MASDSCLVGCGAFFNGRFFHTQFSEFVTKQNLHINALELLTVVVTLKVWGHLIKGKNIIIYCDNSASCKVLNTGFSRDPFLQSCLREICFHAAINEFQIRAREISTGDNQIPDYLSRWDLSPNFEKLFYLETKGLILQEYTIHESLFQFSHDW